MVGRLRSALTQNPGAKRFVIRTRPESLSSSAAGEGAEFVKGFADHPVGVIALPITDTCKEVVNGVVRRTVPRDTLVDARGPWFFARDALERALEAVTGREEGISSALALCRAAGLRVRVQFSE
jgi:2-C-methyl-D-erythritol 4-phosphate cytidylyltransferase